MSGTDNSKTGGNDQSQKKKGQAPANKNRGGARNPANNRPRNNAESSGGSGGSGGGTAAKSRPRMQPIHNHKVDMKKYEKMIGAAHDNFADINLGGGDTDECTICCKAADLFGIGPCRHPVCIECAIRIRVLGDQKSCPVCRGDIATLYLTYASSGLSTVPLQFPPIRHKDEERYNIQFESKSAANRYDKYLAHVCKMCKTENGERVEFPTFIALRQHMANAHHLSYCHICTDNLNLFSRERKTYSRDSLQRHIKSGDADDKSQKGHPSCLYCDSRFFDNDAQYRHLRKEHFFCQFCEADGTAHNVFFGKHPELVEHYKVKHFLCEAEECKSMGIAFSNQFDLNLHRSREHCKKMQLDFSYSDRQLVGASGRSRRGEQQHQQHQQQPSVAASRFERVSVIPRAEPEPAPARPQVEYVVVPSAQSRAPLRYGRAPAPNFIPQAQDFPTLGGAPGAPMQPPAPPPSAADFPRLKKTNKPQQATQSKKQPAKPASREDEFPTLGREKGGGARPGASQAQAQTDWARHSDRFEMIDDDERLASRATASSSAAAAAQRARQQTQPAAASQATNRARPQQPSSSATAPLEDFPSLPLPAGNPRTVVSGKWAQVAKGTGKSVITGLQMPKRQVKAPLPVPDLWPDQKPKPTPASDYTPPEEVWEPVTKRPPTEKDLRAQQRNAEKALKKQAKKEAKEAKKLEMTAPVEDLEMQAVLMNDVIATGSPVRVESTTNGIKNGMAGSVANGERKKQELEKKFADTNGYPSLSEIVSKPRQSNAEANENSSSSSSSDSNGSKNKENQYVKKTSDFPSLKSIGTTPAVKNNKKKTVEAEVEATKTVEEEASNNGGGLGSWFSSVSSMISGLSLSNVLGESVSSGPLSSMQTTAAAPADPTSAPTFAPVPATLFADPRPKSTPSMLPPGLSAPAQPITPSADDVTRPAPILMSAPPGFEDVTPAGPPPGLEIPSPLSFSMAPMLSAADTRRVVASNTQATTDGWQSSKKK